jgi:hypothetical protein
MRSRAEITFRLRQETGNLLLLAFPPRLAGAPARQEKLPEGAGIVERLRGTPYARRVEQIAEQILRHDFPLLGIRVSSGPEIRWRRDYVPGIETGTPYFRRVPYLDVQRAGDHKRIWELNRHQHLVLLAQAWRLTGRREFFTEIVSQLGSWLEQNPFQRGINWVSALEVAFRALSWIWIDHLAGDAMEAGLRSRFLTALYRHGLHLEHNLSIYFSRNTHLLGEALALHAIGALFPAFPGARRWKEQGARLMEREMEFQVRPDGAHFEQSSYYHIYAFDMFLFHAIVGEPSAAYLRKLDAMAEYLEALLGPARAIPFLGDDDGGRLFHPYGERAAFGRASLATAGIFRTRDWRWDEDDVAEQAAWWLGPRALDASPPTCNRRTWSRLFQDSGLVVMADGDTRIYIDAGPMGFQRAGHGHSDALSIVVRQGDREILVDPGTYTYVAEPEWRDRFRGSAAHNTVRAGGRDQAVPRRPFGWEAQPEVRILDWKPGAEVDMLLAVCRYAGSNFTHTRQVRFEKPGRLWILDEVEGPAGEHVAEQFWHPGEDVARLSDGCFRIGPGVMLLVENGVPAELGEGGEYGWRSPALGRKMPAAVIRAAVTAALPVRMGAALLLDAPETALRLRRDGDRLFCETV